MIKKITVRKINIRRTAFVTGATTGCLGLIAGVSDTLVNGIREGFLSPGSSGLLPSLGIWEIVVLPAAGFVAGYVTGCLFTWFFNLHARLGGGFEMIISDKTTNNN